ncbi:hypothetical protein QE152_g22286 [Popillia japonica]|uniref:Uncharacterized protein n=1 Tax=Popillia japonica TaxID=7064 RepID=A0AAW1KLC2_POPJA
MRTAITKCWNKILDFQAIEETSDDEENVPLSMLKEKQKKYLDKTVDDVICLLNLIRPEETCLRNDIEDWNKDAVSQLDNSDYSSDDNEEDGTLKIRVNKLVQQKHLEL